MTNTGIWNIKNKEDAENLIEKVIAEIDEDNHELAVSIRCKLEEVIWFIRRMK